MIRFVVAMAAEARPLISRFRLGAASDDEPFRVFTGGDVELVVSGIGKTAAAAATGYLFARGDRERNLGWINVGIAGAASLEVGCPVLGDSIHDAASGRSWYPPLVFEPPCTTAAVRTVERVETDFEDRAVYEMEAAGFYPIATRFATAELVRVFKVISDNREAPAEGLSAARVTELVEAALDPVERLVEETRAIAAELKDRAEPPDTLKPFLSRWRFSLTQRRRLERLLRRLAVADPEWKADPEKLGDTAKPAEVLRILGERLQSAPARVVEE